jgi:hypothetical protein
MRLNYLDLGPPQEERPPRAKSSARYFCVVGGLEKGVSQSFLPKRFKSNPAEWSTLIKRFSWPEKTGVSGGHNFYQEDHP